MELPASTSGRWEIPVMRPALPSSSAVLPYLERMDRMRVYSNFGPLVRELELRYADYLGVEARQVVTCANATLALMGAVTILPRDAWLTPAWSFPATPQAIVGSGKQLYFKDVGEDDATMQLSAADDPEALGVVPVVPFGGPVDLDRWQRWPVGVLDAAASLGNVPNLSGLRPGWCVVFSLHATKVLGCGEGALAVFGSERAAGRFRSWTTFGFDGKREAQSWGVNAKMPESSAAYGLAALDGWDEEHQDWRRARKQTRIVSDALGLTPAWTPLENVSPYWMVQFESAVALDRAERELSLASIQTRRWWPASLPDTHAFREGLGGSFLVSSHLASTSLGLPCFRDISDQSISIVGECLTHALAG